MFGDVTAKLNGLRHVWAHYVAGVPEKIALYKPYPNSNCLHCHDDARRFVEGVAHRPVLDALYAGTTSCLTCHRSPTTWRRWTPSSSGRRDDPARVTRPRATPRASGGRRACGARPLGPARGRAPLDAGDVHPVGGGRRAAGARGRRAVPARRLAEHEEQGRGVRGVSCRRPAWLPSSDRRARAGDGDRRARRRLSGGAAHPPARPGRGRSAAGAVLAPDARRRSAATPVTRPLFPQAPARLHARRDAGRTVLRPVPRRRCRVRHPGRAPARGAMSMRARRWAARLALLLVLLERLDRARAEPARKETRGHPPGPRAPEEAARGPRAAAAPACARHRRGEARRVRRGGRKAEGNRQERGTSRTVVRARDPPAAGHDLQALPRAWGAGAGCRASCCRAIRPPITAPPSASSTGATPGRARCWPRSLAGRRTRAAPSGRRRARRTSGCSPGSRAAPGWTPPPRPRPSRRRTETDRGARDADARRPRPRRRHRRPRRAPTEAPATPARARASRGAGETAAAPTFASDGPPDLDDRVRRLPQARWAGGDDPVAVRG